MPNAFFGGGAPGHLTRVLFDPDPNGNGGGNTQNDPPKTDPPVSDPTKAFEAALAKLNGDNATLARESFGEAQRLREENANLKAKLPATGAVVLTGDDTTAWEAYRAFGKPDEVKTKLGERDILETKVKARERADLITEAAGRHKLKADVLGQLPGIADLDIRLEKVTRHGKEVPVAQVVTQDASGKEVLTDLDKHAETHWAAFLPALRPSQASQSTPPGRPSRRPASPDTTAPARRHRSTL